MKLKHWIKIIIFAGLSIALIAFLSSIVCVGYERDTVGNYGYYKEPEDSISVGLIGPSMIFTSFYSPLAYEKYGFTSFSFSTADMPGSTYKSAVQVLQSRQKPDLYVVDVWGFTYENQLDTINLRRWIDTIQDPEIRTQTVEELIPEEDWDSYKFPLIKYHSRWKNIKSCLKVFLDKKQINKKGYSVTKNFSTHTTIYKYKQKKSKYEIPEEGLKYLDIFLDYCKENGIENVLFVQSIDCVTYEYPDSYYEMLDKIDKAGYDFLNIHNVAEDIGVDQKHDFYNAGHMNVFGTQKSTDYLSKYIVDHYDLNKDYAPEVVKEWDNCASYNDKIMNHLEELTENKTDKYTYAQRDFY